MTAIDPSAVQLETVTSSGGRRLIETWFANRAARFGTVLLVLIVLCAVFAPLIAPDNPLAQNATPLLGPSGSHPFGTDELGRDIASRVVYAARPALVVSFGSALLAGIVGAAIGIAAGYLGRWVDAVSMRVMDLLLAIPGILAALVVVTVLGTGTAALVLAIALASIPGFARLARASTLSVREREYVEAAKGMAAPSGDLMLRTILPNILGPLIVNLVISASLAVIVTAGLSYLGLGTPPPAASWGAMLKSAQLNLYRDAWYGVFPGVALVITVFALDLVGRGLQSVLGGTAQSDVRGGGL